MKNTAFVTIAFLTYVPSIATAQDESAILTAMFSVEGTCNMLVLHGEERPCKNVMINTEYDNGRLGFYFLDESKGGDVVAFSAQGQEQLSPTAEVRLQPIDALVLSGIRELAVGFCTFENPFIGRAVVQCAAYLENGELFAGFFETNGERPRPMSLMEYNGESQK